MSTEPRCTLPDDLELALPRGRHRRWDQAAVLHLVEPATVEPVTPPSSPPAPASAIQQAERDVMWASSSGEYQAALDRLASLRRGELVASEPVAPAPPVPVPPVAAPGTAWTVTKVVLRDGAGLVMKVEERWDPA